MNTSKSNKPKHFYCAVCEKRLDRVPSWSVVSKIEVISKLNNLKEGIKSGDRICVNCNVKARRKEKNFENSVSQKDVDANEIQNDETSVQIQHEGNVEMPDDLNTSIQIHNKSGVLKQNDQSEEVEEEVEEEEEAKRQLEELEQNYLF